MKRKLFLWVAFLLATFQITAQTFSLPKLNYTYDALQPYIDSTTMRIHYTKHHAAYVNNLNTALQKYPQYYNKGLVEIISNCNQLPEDIRTIVRNNGGGHYNHTMFWSILTPSKNSKMEGKVIEQIQKEFGTIDNFKLEFEKAAASQFGSGWAWLIVDKNSGKLKIISTANQDNPLMDIAEIKGSPILCLDVWEHAYYLNYQNKRPDYIKAFWSVVNWKQVDNLYQEALKVTK